MSYFLCIGMPCDHPEVVRNAFDRRVSLLNCYNMPIGAAIHARNENWHSWLVVYGSSSASLVGPGSRKRRSGNDHSELLYEGLATLLRQDSKLVILLMLHWFHGDLNAESVLPIAEETVDITHIEAMTRGEFDIRADVLYKLCLHTPTPAKRADWRFYG